MVGSNGIGEPIERKYTLLATSTQTGAQHDEHHAMVFLAKDRALPATLAFYLSECRRLGAAQEQITAVMHLMDRVLRYQDANPLAVKVPDVDPTRGAHVFAPNVEPDTAR